MTRTPRALSTPHTSHAPYRFFELEVARTRRVSPSVQRVTFRAARPGGLAEFVSGGRDQRFKLFFAPQGERHALVPVEAGDQWYPAWRAMDPQRRALMRTYTVREQRYAPEPGGETELDVDFAVRQAAGPAAAWALDCVPGDRITALGPTGPDNGGVDFRPPPETDWILLAGDESALPAIAAILADLTPAARVRAWIEVAHHDDIRNLPTQAESRVTWLLRAARITLTESVSADDLPHGRPYAWIAGEATEVRQLRRHLVRPHPAGRGFPKDAVTFTGYWRRGATEEQLLAELLAAGTA